MVVIFHSYGTVYQRVYNYIHIHTYKIQIDVYIDNLM